MQMDKAETYIIPLKDLSLGNHEYDFLLEDEFFERIDAPEVKKGSVKVNVSLKKTSHSFEISFYSKGFVYVPCDRCLEDMKQEIETENQLVVKFGDAYEEVDETLIVVPEYPGEIAKLRGYLREERGEGEDENESGEIDPRWSGLQKLLEDKGNN